MLVLAAAAGVFFLRGSSTPSIESITPARVGLGQSVTITGTHFGATAAENVVRFGGKPGRVVQAAPTRLEVEIPEMAAALGRDTPVPVIVVVDGHESKAGTVECSRPRVSMASRPRWGCPATRSSSPVRDGVRASPCSSAAPPPPIVDTTPSRLKVKVPALEGAPGTEFPRCAWPRAPTPPTPPPSSSAAFLS